MVSIALIGADGAGKTTIADRLRRSFPKPMKYLYMGINIESSNVALPTSRFIERAKKLKNGKTDEVQGASASLHNRKGSLKKGVVKNIWLFIRLFNRLAEEWYRQLLSWLYRRRGFVVLYDRHFLFDFDKNDTNSAQQSLPLAERIHRWCLHRFYPQPDLVLFLDAPPDVLFARKGEATLEFLEGRRHAYLEQGKRTQNFVRIDATQPVDKVYSEVVKEIEKLVNANNN